MNTIEKEQESYYYDYLTVETGKKTMIETVDCYEALGWKLVRHEGTLGLKAAITFKRDRKIQNKSELNKIQTKIDEALRAINSYESQKTTKAFVAAMGIGIPGTLAFGGGISLCLLKSSVTLAMAGGIALGIAGLGLCGLGYLVYRKINKKKTIQMNILIDKTREDIGNILEKAQGLL